MKSEERKELLRFVILKGLSLARNCLRPEMVPLIKWNLRSTPQPTEFTLGMVAKCHFLISSEFQRINRISVFSEIIRKPNQGALSKIWKSWNFVSWMINQKRPGIRLPSSGWNWKYDWKFLPYVTLIFHHQVYFKY